MAKHQAPDRHPVHDRVAIRTTALAMAGLTLFVIAMIASYSGAFAKPMLHHMAVAVAVPNRSSTASVARCVVGHGSWRRRRRPRAGLRA